MGGGRWALGGDGACGQWVVGGGKSIILLIRVNTTKVTSRLNMIVYVVLFSVEATVRAARNFPLDFPDCYHLTAHLLPLTEGLMGVESGSEGSDEARQPFEYPMNWRL